MDTQFSAPFFKNALPISEQVSVGKDAKNLLVLLHGDKKALEEYYPFLKKVLQSIHYDFLTEIHLVVGTNPLYDIPTYCRDRNIQKIIDFGKNPADLGFKIKKTPYTLQRIYRFTYLHCDTIGKIHDSKELKNKLWNALKAMFNEEG